MFWIGAAPTLPGINDKFSIPPRLFLSAHKTISCQFSPALISTITSLIDSLIIEIPLLAIWIVRPLKLVVKSMLLPPPNIR